MVIPHSHGHVDRIGLEEQFHVTYFLDPFVETILALAGQLEDEVLELGLGSLVCSLLPFVFIGIVASVIRVQGPVPVDSVEIGLIAVVPAFPEIAGIAAEHSVQAFLDIFVINRLNHLIDTVICRSGIPLDVNPETAVSVIRGSPYPVTAEEVIAIQFPDIGRVILEPFQVDLAYSLDCMGFVLVEFAEI